MFFLPVSCTTGNQIQGQVHVMMHSTNKLHSHNHYLQSWMNWGQDSVPLSLLSYLLSPLQWSVWQFIQDTLLLVWGTLVTDGGCDFNTSGSNMTPQFKTQKKVNRPKAHLLSIIQQSVSMFPSLFLSEAHTAAMDSHKTTLPWNFGHLEIAEGNSKSYAL